MSKINTRAPAPEYYSNKSSPFYCHKKNCRKTAWETPEYLTEEDWKMVRGALAALEAGDLDAFLLAIKPDPDSFFDRILGWPEGYQYMWRGTSKAQIFHFSCLKKHEEARLRNSLASHSKNKQHEQH